MILADAAPTIAVLNDRDPDHLPCLRFVREARETIAVPAVVIAEVSHFLVREGRLREEELFLRSLADGSVPVIDAEARDYLRAADLVLQFADFPLGAVDALIVAIAERLDVTTILTLDRRHFGAVRPLYRPSFTLVP